MLVTFFSLFCLVEFAAADLRMASQPNVEYQLRNQGTTPWNLSPWKGQMHYRYMEPSTFNYKGLANQKQRNYDNFLRSNIDNEQDNRNFNDEDGKDHLPFRTQESDVFDTHTLSSPSRRRRIPQLPDEMAVAKVVKAGESMTVPLRWNNPHASEMEVNIWIFEQDSKIPVVVPIRKPSCSGEGYQDNVVTFTVPKDFTSLGGKIPGFKGCNSDSKPMCTLQIYSHSVESRTYAIGFPIEIPGHDASLVTAKSVGIEDSAEDPWLDLSGLRELCLPATDTSATIPTAKPRWARLVSDVFNHAYQNSDYSPYSGQQHEAISRNLQASAINKMEVGNRGELGKSIVPKAAYDRLRYLQGLENRVYKNYEALANKIINSVGNQMKNTGTVGVQQLGNCFRCLEAGSTNTNRLQTNTYIPSFTLPQNLVATARRLVPSKYASLITDSGVVQIYSAALKDLLPFYYKSRHLGLIYQEAVVKTTTATMLDATSFKKRDASGKADGGKYAALAAKKKFFAARGCPSECLDVKPKTPALLQDDRERASRNSQWKLTGSTRMGGRYISGTRPVTHKIDLGSNKWLVGVVDGRWLKMTELEITGERTFRWIASKYTRARRQCKSPSTFVRECFTGRSLRSSTYYQVQTSPTPFVKDSAANGTPARSNGPQPANGAWYCVPNANKKTVRGPYNDIKSATDALNESPGSYRNQQMVCEMSKNGAKSDPHWVGGQNQGAGPRGGFQKYWSNWNMIRQMNAMCNSNDMCKLNGVMPQQDPTVWFCVANYNQKFVSGPYNDVVAAKAELNKSVGSSANQQMICEMSKNGAKRDPHIVGGLNQGGGPANGFQKYWSSSTYYHRMNAMCNANIGCKARIPKDEIEGPLVAGSLATNITGKCKPCLQFFGKKVHPMREPAVSRLADDITKRGMPSNVDRRDQLPDNPNFVEKGVTRRRTSLLVQGGQGQGGRKTRKGSKRKRQLRRVGEFLERADQEQFELMGLEALEDVIPLPSFD